MYCSTHPKASVSYNFNSGETRTFFTEKTPIDVRVVERWIPEFTGGQCPVVYRITYLHKNPYQNPEEQQIVVELFGWIEGIQYEFSFPGDANYDPGSGAYALVVAYHGSSTVGQRVRTVLSGSSGGIILDKSRYTVRILSVVRKDGQPDTCGDPKKICELQVLKDGKIIFLDQGQCPGSFNVQCGDCPPGTMRCNSSGYPGYCCIPCKEIAGEIKAIANQVRSINNG